jgi:hypothetical protein
MGNLIKFDNSAHWYDRAGNPQHDADLRVARKSGLYGSVTSIDKDSFPNLFLDRWKMEQLVKACVETPRMPHEDEEQYAQRVYDISNTKARVAAAFGKEIHGAVEKYPNPPKPHLQKWYDSFSGFYQANIVEKIATEKVLLDHDIGVAGTADFIGVGSGWLAGLVVADWKTQDVKVDKKGKKTPNFYDSWTRQLGVYAVAYAKETGAFPFIPHCLSVIIDSNDDAGIYYKHWPHAGVVAAYEDFVAGAWLWCRKRNYWPNGNPWRIQDIPSVVAV